MKPCTVLPLVLVITISLSKSVLSQSSCPNANALYPDYLSCLKDRIDGNYGALETEFREDYQNLILQCFGNGPPRQTRKCYFKGPEVFRGAFGSAGPLRDCRMCQKIAGLVERMFVTANERSLRCMRGHITEAVGKELRVCIKRRLPEFVMPDLRNYDFDAQSRPYRRDIVSTTSTFVIAEHLLGRCEAKQSAQPAPPRRGRRQATSSVFGRTNACMKQRTVNGRPIWAQHCNIMKQCRRNHAPGCQLEFKRVETETCRCIEKKKGQLSVTVKRAGERIREVIERRALPTQPDACMRAGERTLDVWKKCRCKKIISAIVDDKRASIDVRDYFKRIVGCFGGGRISADAVSVDKLISLGCRHVVKHGQRGARDLIVGVDFITKVFDALVARVTRFCPGTHCRV